MPYTAWKGLSGVLRSRRTTPPRRHNMADQSHSTPDAHGSEIAALTTRVLAAWRKRLRRKKDGPPRTGERGDCERHLVSALLRVSQMDDEQSLPALAAAAAHYGTEQPGARLTPRGLGDEFAALRQIIVKQLTRAGSNDGAAAAACLGRLDQAIAIVAKAAGSHLDERATFGPTPSTDGTMQARNSIDSAGGVLQHQPSRLQS